MNADKASRLYRISLRTKVVADITQWVRLSQKAFQITDICFNMHKYVMREDESRIATSEKQTRFNARDAIDPIFINFSDIQ